MNTSVLLLLFAFAFELYLGLASASPISTAAGSLSLNRRVSQTPPAAATRGDNHLCFGLTDISYDYGNTSHQNDTISDCDKLLQQFKGLIDVQGNVTKFCGGPIPGGVRPPAGFELLGSQGNCALWSQCLASDTKVQVAFGYGDIADVIKLATDGLKSSGPGTSKNSSIVSVRASTECQTLQSDWVVAFDGSEPGIVSEDGGPPGRLRNMTSNFIPVEELQQ